MEEGHDEAEGEEAAADAWVGVALETDRLLVPPKNSGRLTIQRLSSSGGTGTLRQDNRFQRPEKIRSWGFRGGREARPANLCSC